MSEIHCKLCGRDTGYIGRQYCDACKMSNLPQDTTASRVFRVSWPAHLGDGKRLKMAIEAWLQGYHRHGAVAVAEIDAETGVGSLQHSLALEMDARMELFNELRYAVEIFGNFHHLGGIGGLDLGFGDETIGIKCVETLKDLQALLAKHQETD